MPLALPPMSPPSGPAGPVAPASANPGLAAAASAQVREAISIMEKALAELPTGGDEHKAVLDSLTKLSKAFPASAAVPGVQKTALAGLAQRANSDAMIKQAMASMGPKPGAGPGGLPAMPPASQPAPMGAM